MISNNTGQSVSNPCHSQTRTKHAGFGDFRNLELLSSEIVLYTYTYKYVTNNLCWELHFFVSIVFFMNNKEKSLWEMCEREREFCHFLIFRSGWKWCRCEEGYQFSSQAIEWRNFFYKSFAPYRKLW